MTLCLLSAVSFAVVIDQLNILLLRLTDAQFPCYLDNLLKY